MSRMDQMPTVRDRVRQLLDETELVDPHDIADQIMDSLHGPEVRSALAECLSQYVRIVLSDERYFDRLGSSKGVDANHEPTGGSSRSTKWTTARSLLRRPYFVGEWRQFGDLTTADVAWLAEDRYQRAKNLTTSGDRFSAVHDLMVRTEVEYVRDLPEDDLVGIMR